MIGFPVGVWLKEVSFAGKVVGFESCKVALSVWVQLQFTGQRLHDSGW